MRVASGVAGSAMHGKLHRNLLKFNRFPASPPLKETPGRPKFPCPLRGRAGRSPALGVLNTTSC